MLIFPILKPVLIDKPLCSILKQEVNGRLLKVNRAAPRGTRVERQPRQARPQFSIYVGNLSWSVDEARLEQVFSEYGKVVSSRVMYDRESGRSRGFGFVAMETKEEMNDAIAALDGKVRKYSNSVFLLWWNYVSGMLLLQLQITLIFIIYLFFLNNRWSKRTS